MAKKKIMTQSSESANTKTARASSFSNVSKTKSTDIAFKLYLIKKGVYDATMLFTLDYFTYKNQAHNYNYIALHSATMRRIIYNSTHMFCDLASKNRRFLRKVGRYEKDFYIHQKASEITDEKLTEFVANTPR